jgi:hypothetical protein
MTQEQRLMPLIRVILTSFLILSPLCEPVWALTTIRTGKEYIPLKVQTALSSQAPLSQAPLRLMLADDIQLKDVRLPSGSVLSGTVVAIRPSKRLGRPAQAKVRFDQLTLAEGQVVTLTPQKPVRLRQNRRKSFGSMMGKQVLINSASNLVTIPMLLSGVGTGVALIVGNAIDATVGAIAEVRYHDPDDHRSTLRRAAVGAFNGLIILPTIVALARKAPELSWQVDQPIQQRFHADFWQGVEADVIEQASAKETTAKLSSDPPLQTE